MRLLRHPAFLTASLVTIAEVVARTICIAKGAVIEGSLTVTSGQPVVQFDEKRTFGELAEKVA